MRSGRARLVFQRRGRAELATVPDAGGTEPPRPRGVPAAARDLAFADPDRLDGHSGIAIGRLAGTRLLALLDSCTAAGVGRRAAMLRLSSLPADLARPSLFRLARATLDPLVFADRAALFRLPSEDLIVVWRGEADAAVAQVREAVAHLFDEERRVDLGDLLLLLDLPEHAALLRDVVVAQLGPQPRSGPALPDSPALDPPALLLFERALGQTDLASFVRRQQVCTMGADGTFQLAWEKRRISVGDLTAALLPGRSARADPWLFRRLTRTLDRRMLALLTAPGELRDAGPFSLDLNVASILSPDFLRFDGALPSSLRGRVMLELLPTDLLADSAAFLFARDFARARGYRLSLRGIGADLLPVFPRARTGLDLLQLRWSPALAEADLRPLAEAPERVMLARCDTQEGLAWGRSQRLGFFQGRAVTPAPPPPATRRNGH